MEKMCYKLPLHFSKFFEEGMGKLTKCTERESINQYLEMLLLTCPGEHRFDERFGTKIWELDFERVNDGNEWKQVFTEYVKEAILQNEKRIKDIAIKVAIQEIVKEEMKDNRSVRKRVDIIIEGIQVSTGERCAFGYNLYLGPLSNE